MVMDRTHKRGTTLIVVPLTVSIPDDPIRRPAQDIMMMTDRPRIGNSTTSTPPHDNRMTPVETQAQHAERICITSVLSAR